MYCKSPDSGLYYAKALPPETRRSLGYRYRVSMHRNLYIESGLVAVFLLALLGLAAAQEVIVSPQITEIEVPPGGRKTFEVTVGNAGELSALVAHIGVSSIVQNNRGDYTISDSENNWSCAPWITLDKQRVALEPGEWEVIRCQVEVPFNASGGRYAAITVSFGDMAARTPGLTTSFQYVLGSYVELTVSRGPMTRRAEISNLQVTAVAGNPILENQYGRDSFFIVADVTNTGNIGILAKAMLRVREQRGLHRREAPLGTGRGMVLPDATVKYRSLFTRKPPPGIYVAEASLDYGSYKPAVTRLIFSVTQDGDIVPGRVESVETVGLGINPRAFDLRGGPGARKTVGVTLSNVEEIPLTIAVEKLGLYQRSDGRLDASSSNTELSCHDWITVEPDSFEIAPNSRKRVRISLSIPREASGSRYARIAFVPQNESVSREAMATSYSTDIFLTIQPGLEKAVAIMGLGASSEGRFKPVNISFRVQNTGNCHVSIGADVSISGPGGRLVKEISLPGIDTRILPGVTRVFTIADNQGLESGNYTVDLAVRIGTEAIERSRCNLVIHN